MPVLNQDVLYRGRSIIVKQRPSLANASQGRRIESPVSKPILQTHVVDVGGSKPTRLVAIHTAQSPKQIRSTRNRRTRWLPTGS